METGFKKLDEIVKIKEGDLILIGGTAFVGKTNFALNIIILLHRDECFNNFTQKKNVADVIIAKNKNGIEASIELAWNSKYLKFLNL